MLGRDLVDGAACMPAPSAASSAPHGVCSVDFRFYCQNVANGSCATIGLRCFAVNGDKDEELYQLQFAREAQPFSAASQSRSHCEWRDVSVPCRSVLEVSFTLGGNKDVYMVYVGQVPKLFIMAKDEDELLRCLTHVHPENWFLSHGPDLSPTPPPIPSVELRVVVPPQFSAPRYSKVMLFDLKTEGWNVDSNLVFHKVAGQEPSEFIGRVSPSDYRLYLWDVLYEKWVLDGCILQIRESTLPNRAVLFGHRQDGKEDSFGRFRVMDAQVRAHVCRLAAVICISLNSPFR